MTTYIYQLLSESININWWIVAIVAIICFAIASIKTVSEREMALWIILGYILMPFKSGPHFVPWPSRLEKAPKTSIKVDFGTLDKEEVERINMANASQSWYVFAEPMRINWGDIESSGLSEIEMKQYENDPLAKRLTTDPHLYFIFKVHDLRKLVEVAGGLNEAMDRIRDTCFTALQEEAGKTFLAKAVKEIDQLSEKILREVEWLVGDPDATSRAGRKPNESWGVDVKEVRIKALGTSHAVNTAVSSRSAKAAEAAGDAIATTLRAGAEEVRLTKEGKGRAAAKTVEAEAEQVRLTKEGEGRAAAITARAKAVSEEGGELVVKLDALETGLEHGKTVILPADLSILTAATSVKAVLDELGKKEGE